MSQYEYSNRVRKRKLKKVPVIITILAVVMIIGGLYYFLLRGDNQYKDYQTYNEKNKSYGTVENYEKDTNDFYTSIYYPKYDDKTLNEIVQKTYKEFIKKEKKKKDQKDILYMDYSSKRIYKQYVAIEFQFKRVDSQTDKKTKQKKVMTYNEKTKKLLTLDDCLHGKYRDILINLGIADIQEQSTNIIVGKDQFTYYTDDQLSNKIDINYNDYKDYIKLANKNIPSNAPLDVKTPNEISVDKDKKMIAITLDDGPHKTLTQRAMNAFENNNGRATFFELGKNVEAYPDVVKDVYERGFEIGSHTYAHAQLTKLDAASLDAEIKQTQDAVFKITGEEPKVIRPPYGARNDNVRAAFASYGLTNVLWDVDTEDWKYRDANYVCDQIVNGAYDGAIILIHDIHETSIAGLELALPKLAEKGYQFVTVSQLYEYKGHTEYK